MEDKREDGSKSAFQELIEKLETIDELKGGIGGKSQQAEGETAQASGEMPPTEQIVRQTLKLYLAEYDITSQSSGGTTRGIS